MTMSQVLSPCRSALIVGIFLFVFGCASQHPFGGGYSRDQQFVSILPHDDSISVYPSTHYFYRYVVTSEHQPFTPEWALGNLTHLGIKVEEAWYDPGAPPRNRGNGAIGNIPIPPLFIVGLAIEDPAIMEHNYEPIENFNPPMLPYGSQIGMLHYVSRRLLPNQ